VKLSDYPGTDLTRKQLHRRLSEAYQLAAALLLCDMPKEARLEAEIVLLDFLSDPASATPRRLSYAARAFRGRVS
jgi:hypothetical protein